MSSPHCTALLSQGRWWGNTPSAHLSRFLLQTDHGPEGAGAGRQGGLLPCSRGDAEGAGTCPSVVGQKCSSWEQAFCFLSSWQHTCKNPMVTISFKGLPVFHHPPEKADLGFWACAEGISSVKLLPQRLWAQLLPYRSFPTNITPCHGNKCIVSSQIQLRFSILKICLMTTSFFSSLITSYEEVG